MYIGFPDLQNLPKKLKIPHNVFEPGIPFANIEGLREVTANLVKEYLDGMANFKHENQAMPLSGRRVWRLAGVVQLLQI